MLKKLIYLILGFLVLLIVVIVLIPFLFKGELQDLATTEINKNINAKLAFDEVNVSLIKSFPDFSVCLEGYEIHGMGEFEGISLAKGKSFCLNANVWSVISKSTSIKVRSVSLDEPNLNIVVAKSGNTNYNITKPNDETTTASGSPAYELNLENYKITNGIFSYIDKSSGLYMHAEDIDHEGVGNFTASLFDLITNTSASNVVFSTGGINYISRAKLDLDAIFNIDLNQSKYTLKENDLVLNALHINADGFVQTVGDAIKMDLVFSTPTNSLKELISLVPGAYTKDYSNVDATGAVSFKGFAKGTYNAANNKLPEFSVDIDVKEGKLKYPDLPLGISGINSDISIKSPSSDFDDMVIDIKQLNLNVGDEPFEGRLLLKTPVSDPDIDTKMKGKIDLAQFAKAFPMDGVENISGIIDTDFEIKTKMSTLDRGAYTDADMRGKFAIANMNYKSDEYPPINIKQMQIDFIPEFLKVNQFDAQLGKSDIKASGKIDNFLAWFAPDKTMKGDLVISSGFFDADEWMHETEESAETLNNTTTTSEEDSEEVFDRFDFKLDTKIDRIKYATYDLRNNAMKGHFTPNTISLDNFQTEIGKSDFKGRGKLSNVFPYLFDGEVLEGDISLNSDYINVNQFMTEGTGEAQAKTIASEDDLEPFKVPENIDIDLTADIRKLHYTDLDVTKVKGLIEIQDEAMKMDKVNMKTLGGNMNISGLYDSKDTEEPKFELTYSVDKLNFKETFEKLNTFKILMPMAEFLDGDFSTDMSFNGLLGKDMIPNLNTLNAEGFIQTFNAILNNFEPLSKVGEKLNIDWLRKFTIDDSKNWFSVKDGKVVLEETKHKFRNIEMLVGGSHGFSNDMDYTMKARIPKELLGDNTVTQVANKGLDFLNKEASKLGVNIANGDFVNVLINVTGTMLSPKIKITPTGAEGQSVKDIAKDVVNQVKETVVDTVTKVVTKVVDNTKELAATEKAKLEAEAEVKIKKIKDEARKQVEKVRAESKKRADQAKELAYQQADKLVEKASGNPFKKLAAQEGAKIAKRKADDIHRASLAKVNQTTTNITKKADAEAAKIRANYDKRITALEKKAGM